MVCTEYKFGTVIAVQEERNCHVATWNK